MATIKSFSDLQQSKKLAEILPLESADMIYTMVNGRCTPFVRIETIEEIDEDDVLCWSLATLLDVLPSRLFDSTPKRKELYLLPDLDKSYCFYRQFAVKTKGKIYLLTEGECIVDACYEMIIKLHELNLL